VGVAWGLGLKLRQCLKSELKKKGRQIWFGLDLVWIRVSLRLD
jgi:hypothetical protein